MLAIVILGAVAGAVLASHFKIFVLGPAMLLACAATVVAGCVSGMDAHTIVVAVLAVFVSLQLGYVAGGVAAAHFSLQTKQAQRNWTPSQYY